MSQAEKSYRTVLQNIGSVLGGRRFPNPRQIREAAQEVQGVLDLFGDSSADDEDGQFKLLQQQLAQAQDLAVSQEEEIKSLTTKLAGVTEELADMKLQLADARESEPSEPTDATEAPEITEDTSTE